MAGVKSPASAAEAEGFWGVSLGLSVGVAEVDVVVVVSAWAAVPGIVLGVPAGVRAVDAAEAVSAGGGRVSFWAWVESSRMPTADGAEPAGPEGLAGWSAVAFGASAPSEGGDAAGTKRGLVAVSGSDLGINSGTVLAVVRVAVAGSLGVSVSFFPGVSRAASLGSILPASYGSPAATLPSLPETGSS
jgi:hypothetical protein